jgi:hypothetical protein
MHQAHVPYVECDEICDIENSNFIAQPDGPYWAAKSRFVHGTSVRNWTSVRSVGHEDFIVQVTNTRIYCSEHLVWKSRVYYQHSKNEWPIRKLNYEYFNSGRIIKLCLPKKRF